MPLCSSCGSNTYVPRVAVDFLGLHDRLRTLSGPASVQPDEVASVLQNIQRDLEDYEVEICRLECLRQEKERLEQYATQFQSLLSPFRKVPDEILQCIFDDCCDMNIFRVVDSKRRLPMHSSQALRSKPAMVISSVCSRWRRNALSMPAIWSRISLEWRMNATRDYCEDEHAQVFFPISNFLDRSQEYPMTVNLDIQTDSFLKPGVLHPSLEQFLGHIVRWQDLSFNCAVYSIKDLLDRISFPVLRKLYLSTCMIEEDLIPFIDTVPNLRSLSLVNHDDFSGRFTSFNFKLLSHLDLAPNQADIQDSFDQCPNLFSLGITESWQDSRAEGPMKGPYSSRIEILTVRHGCCWSVSDASDSVFPLLSFPSLKALHLENSESGGWPIKKYWNNFKPFMMFVKQSSFQLTTFSIQQLSISDANLVYILVHLPTLQNLTVDDISPDRSPLSSCFIENLHGYHSSSLHPQTGSIIPRLQSLRLLNVAAKTFSDLSVVEMVQSRWIPTRRHAVGTSALEVDCLREFTLTFLNRSEAEAGAYRSLDPIERNGMRIVVRMLKKEGEEEEEEKD
ncbi:hypothetical protein BDP27DRAFT_1323766 [Rhodocollybia butyracea]|uniref:F-box domain-containing protein n=1 Tax=Rhodocollybia butyracea TaxID=206335 RepID=A0A9P5PW53_9AGAR|nr:hypothetical protein BDP27DRAFT_1323766 [Rhodocollybia butyracea]